MERNCNTTLEIIFCGVVPACIIKHSSQKINTGVLLAFQDKGNQHRETLAYYATFLSDVWNKPQKLSEWCGIKSSFWIMIHRKSVEAVIVTDTERRFFHVFKGKGKGIGTRLQD